MNWSLGELTAEVPLGVVTVTSTVPVPAGAVTVRLVAVTDVEPRCPRSEPKWTAVAPVKSVPVTVTEVPPPAGPLVGLSPVTVGGGVVGVGVGQRRGRTTGGGGHGHRDRAGPRRDGHREAGGGDPADPGARRGAEDDRRGPGEVGAVDRDGVAPGLGPVVRADRGDRRRPGCR